MPLDETIIYETHVKGISKRHPAVPEELRGTYAGLGHPELVGYLSELGVTAVELLPVHQFVHDSHLLERGLRNYWGYNSIGFLAPHGEYSSSGDGGGQVDEFKSMVKALHAAGLEVILDVVFNHTAEGNHLGPTLSLKGIDNPSYYRLVDDDQAHYFDTTGTGNSLNVGHPAALRLILDSLRYWVAGDARRRVSVRPGDGPDPAERRPGHPQRLPRSRLPGSGTRAREADRRAVGRRRVPARRVPGALVGVERHVSRHGQGILARRGGAARRFRLAGQRQQRHLRVPSAGADRERQLRHRP